MNLPEVGYAPKNTLNVPKGIAAYMRSKTASISIPGVPTFLGEKDAANFNAYCEKIWRLDFYGDYPCEV